MAHERTDRTVTPLRGLAETYLEAGVLLGQEIYRSIKTPHETRVMPRTDGSLVISGRHVTAAMDRDQVNSFHDRRSGLTYQPVDGNVGQDGVRKWNVTDRAGRQVGTWEGKIEADKRSGEIKKTGSDSATTYKANGVRETKYPGGGTEIETPDGRKSVTVNGHTFVIEPRPVARPAPQPRPDGQPLPGPQQPRGDALGQPVPRPGPGPDGRMPPLGPQPGDRPQVPPQGRTGGDQPWPPQARPTGGDDPQPRPTPERPPQPRPEQGPRMDQALLDQLMNLFRLLQARFSEQPEQLRGRPPLVPPGLDLAHPRKLIGTPRVNPDGSLVYTYEEDVTEPGVEPRFYAVEQLNDGKITERSVLYRQPQTMVFQAERGQPPIKLENVRQSVTKLMGDTYTTTVTCVGPDGKPVNHEFKTKASDGTVTQSPPLENRPLADFKTWTPLHVQALSPESAGKLTATQIKEIPADAVAAFNEAQIKKLTPDAVAGMSEDQIKRLTPVQFKSLTEAQLGRLTESQMKVLTKGQLEQLTREQAQALLKNQKVGSLSQDCQVLLTGKAS